MGSSFIHLIRTDSNVFFLMAKYYSIVYMYHSFLIHLSADNSIETCILSSMKQITSPGWIRETSARGWYTGMTKRDGMGREAAGGFRMWNTCKSMADSCQCVAKTTKRLQYCKVISLQLIKINGKKNFSKTFNNTLKVSDTTTKTDSSRENKGESTFTD